jgi:hypothetical protein
MKAQLLLWMQCGENGSGIGSPPSLVSGVAAADVSIPFSDVWNF